MKPLLRNFALLGLGAVAMVGAQLVEAASIPAEPSVFETYLASQQLNTDNSLTLASATLRDGTSLSGFVCLTIDSNSPSLEYECGTMSGTTMSVTVRGIDAVSGTTSVTSLEFTHRRGADVKITDYPFLTLVARILTGIEGSPSRIHYDTDFTSYNSTDLIDYAQLTRTAFGSIPVAVNAGGTGQVTLPLNALLVGNGTGAVSATTSPTVGWVTATTTTATSTFAGGVNFASTTGTAIFAGNTTTSGTATFNGLAVFNGGASGLLSPYFGNGRDGSLTVASNSTTTLTRDMFYTNLTVNGALVTNGCRVYVSGTLSGSGSINYGIANAGSNGSSNSSGTGGSGGNGGATTTTSCSWPNSGGTPGGRGKDQTGSNGTNGGSAFNSPSLGQAGVIGGTGGTGSNTGPTSPGTAGISATTTLFGVLADNVFSGTDSATSTALSTAISRYFYSASTPSTGGAGGGSDSVTNGGGGGGGAGASGGIIWIFANTWSGTFAIISQGAKGGNGGSAPTDTGGGGGAGGNGGDSVVVYNSKSWTGSYTLSGGLGGTATQGGSSGNNGLTGSSYEIPISSLVR